jgi:hypothetical protein
MQPQFIISAHDANIAVVWHAVIIKFFNVSVQ